MNIIRPALLWLLLALPAGLCAQVPFTLSATLTNGTFTTSVAAADVNNDGRPDLICARASPSFVYVWTNNGSGGFVSNVSYATGGDPRQVLVADVNNDGWLDVVTPDLTGDTLTVLTNVSNGQFVLAAHIPVGSGEPGALAAGDFFGRGRLDLVVANTKLPSFAIWTNATRGLFASNATYNPPPNGTPQCVATADVNGDGKPDFIGACAGSNTNLCLWTNNGAGGFAPAPVPLFPTKISYVIPPDANGDGKPDLVLLTNNSVIVLTNDGRGQFVASGTCVLVAGLYAVTAADVRGTGKPDLIVCNSALNTLTVLTNAGNGVFGSNTTLNVGSMPVSVAAADFNGDGRMDLVNANYLAANSLMIFTNAATFLPQLKLTAQGNNILVSWPAIWANWTLKQTTNLVAGGWTSFSGPIGNDGTTKTATNSSPVDNRFFRLSSP